MTERQLINPPGTQPAPGLTRRAEQRLLEEAHAAGIATLAPRTPVRRARPLPPEGQAPITQELAGLVRRYPLAAASLALGAALLLTRRRKGHALARRP